MLRDLDETENANARCLLSDKLADPSGEKMQALAWEGKNKVSMVRSFTSEEKTG